MGELVIFENAISVDGSISGLWAAESLLCIK